MRNTQWMTSMAFAGAIFASGACMADDAVLSNADGLALLKKNNCTACHAVDKKVVGPAFKDVAAKYRGQADAEAKLTAKVSKGGAGSWGSMPMPPQPAKADDVKALVKFVLSL